MLFDAHARAFTALGGIPKRGNYDNMKTARQGVVEKNVQDARRRIWMDAKQQCFRSFDTLNTWLEARCRALWLSLPHPDYVGITVADALEQERPYLLPMPTPLDGYVDVLARVSSTCLVTVQRNRYSVPCHLANHKVVAHLYPGHIGLRR